MMTMLLLLVLFLPLLVPSVGRATATDFDGTTTRVTVGAQTPINTTAFTFGCWVRMEGDGEGGFGRIAEKNVTNVGWVWFVNGSDVQFRADWNTTDGNWTSVKPATNTWQHFAVAYNGAATTNEPIVYVDGVSVTVTQSGGDPAGTFTNTDDLDIGNSGASDRTFDGQMADCFQYNRVLAANEIKQVMMFGPPSLSYGFVAYWPFGIFNGLNVSGIQDLSGNEIGTANTLNNGPPVNYPQGAILQ